MHSTSYTGLRSFSGNAAVAARIDVERVWCLEMSCMHGMGDMQYAIPCVYKIITDVCCCHLQSKVKFATNVLQLVKKHLCFVTCRWVTNRDSLAPGDPCFFCDVCFRMLHYDAEGNKLGEFLAYPYVDPGIFN